MREKASATIEAAIVMSTLLFIIFAIISAFLLLYQNAVMEYVATQAAQQGAVYWTDTSVQMDGSRSGKDSNGLYYRIGEMAGGNAGKCDHIKRWAEDKMKSMIPRSIVGSGAEQVSVTFKSGLMQRYIIVEIKKEVNIPFAGIMQYFSDDLDMKAKVQASISEPAEYIRTLDFASQTLSEAWKAISGKLGTVTSFFKS